MKRTTILFALIFAALACAQEDRTRISVRSLQLPEPILDSSPFPKYPPVAREARIEGKVQISFLLNARGEVTDVKAISGHPMLARPAVDVVSAWRFIMPRNLYRTEWRYETEFVYQLSGHEVDSYERPKMTVTVASFHRVEITSDTVKPVVSP